MTVPSSSSSTTPNGERTCATTIVAAAPARLVLGEERAKVDVEQLVAVEREHRPCLLRAARPRAEGRRRGRAAPARRPPRSRRPSPASAFTNASSCPGAARDDHARDAGTRRAARPRTPRAESLRPARAASAAPAPPRRAAPPCRPRGGVPPSGGRLAVARRLGLRRRRVPAGGRSPSYSKPAAARGDGVEQVPAVDDERPRHRVAHLGGRELAAAPATRSRSPRRRRRAPRRAPSRRARCPGRSSGRATGSHARTSAPSESSR